VLAGLLLLGLAGCLQNLFLARQANSGRYVQAVNGPPGRVANVLEAGFSGTGIAVLVKRQEGEIRLVGQTKPGQVVCFSVRPDQRRPSQSTVSVDWGGPPDEELWGNVVQWLATFPPPKDNVPK
jgi:hypothetical protein